MPNINLKTDFKYEGNQVPEYSHSTDAAMDVRADVRSPITIFASSAVIIPTGLYMALPETPLEDWKWVMEIVPRSGLAAKHGISVLNSPGTIDAGYRGEVKVILCNTNSEGRFIVEPGDRIAQMKLTKSYKIRFQLCLDLPESDRGEKGFGDTGVK